MAKVFKSVNQQITILQSRGMVFNYYQEAKEELKNKNYYNLINGMKKLFVDTSDPTTEKYKKNLSFDEVLAVFSFDKALRALFLKYILIVESELRTHIAYEFARLESPYSWDNTSAFEYTTPLQQRYVNELINKLNSNATRSQNDSHDDMLNHFTAAGEKIPIWALINTFDFGTLKKFYLNSKEKLRDAVAKYYSLNSSQVKSFLEALNMFRNVCAHDFRILFYRIYDYNKRIPNTNVHANLKIEINTSNDYIYGKNDLFSVAIILKYMLSSRTFRMIYRELNKLVKNIKRSIKVISFDDVLESIGFPQKTNTQLSWKKIKRITK